MSKKKKTNKKKLPLFSITLNNSGPVIVDNRKKTVVYFCKGPGLRVDAQLISELNNALNKIGNKNLRVCLHNRLDAPMHEMIILERSGKYYKPHKHLKKDEVIHIIEGKMGVFSFDAEGNVTDACILKPGNNFIYKAGANMFHAVMPLSDVAIYHESKIGPYFAEGDSVYPSWVPDGNDPKEVSRYTGYLRKVLIIKTRSS